MLLLWAAARRPVSPSSDECWDQPRLVRPAPALTAATLLLPAIYAMAGPYRTGPLLLAAGLLFAGFARGGRWLKAIGAAAIESG